ncbi:MAG: SLBB domain-containing protein [Bacteroidota bacterium]
MRINQTNELRIIPTPLLCLLTFIFILSGVIGQDIGSTDVRFLSDEQISQYWQRAQSEGYSLNQVKSAAIARGMDPAQADLLVERIRELDEDAEGGGGLTQSNLRGLQQAEGMDLFLNGSEEDLELTPFERKLFGYKLFHNDNVDFSPNYNMPTPGDYVLGPGDEVIIQIYGTSQESYQLTIDPEGRLLIPLLGPVQMSGLSMNAARIRLKERLSKIYSGLVRDRPSVFMDVSLGSIRTIRVNVWGEVQRPGTYALPSFATPFMALYSCGGPTTIGTFREIEIYRDGQLAETIDIYQFLRSGQLGALARLQDNDIILVRPFGNHVEVLGSVKRAGIFELKPEETLVDLMDYAGGFRPGAIRESVSLERLNGGSQSIQDVALDAKLRLIDGDKVIVRKGADPLIEKVQIEGAVANPGAYGWSQGLSISDLVAKAGGLSPEAYLQDATLFRKKSDLSTQTISIKLSEVLENGTPFSLEIGDLVVVSSRYELSETPFIEVSGEVINPGVMPFFEGMTISDAILLSSGLRNSGVGGRVELVRRPESAQDDFEVEKFDIPSELFPFEQQDLKYALKPYDNVFVRQAPGFRNPSFVAVEGEVIAPGKYILNNRQTRISDLLPRSGGITDQAYVEGAHLLRPEQDLPARERARLYLQNVERLNLFLTQQLAGGTLSEVERAALDARLNGIRERYREILLNSGEFESDSVLNSAMDSIFIDRPREYAKISFSLRDILEGSNDPENDLILRDGDRIVIPLEPQTVKISGEVLQEEAFARYQKNLRFDNYIGAAGGYTPVAKRNKAYVIYPNGDAKRSRSFILFKTRPPILPGSEIVVPGGRVRETFNIDRIFGLVTTAATTYLLILTVQDRTSQ